ncbi:hypothetical protein OIU76_025061 [Salix suchowensis]|nr:hypothetical protein OIU76_025061 [Salix suchowensis]
MDTGTAVTRFPTVAYEAFRNAFIEQTQNLPRASAVSIFDTCFNLFGFLSVRAPSVLHLLLPRQGFPSSETFSKKGFKFLLTKLMNFVGFGPNIC